MGAFNAATGKLSLDGTNAASSIRDIKINHTDVGQQPITNSSTGSMESRVASAQDFTGSFSADGKTTVALPGDSCSLIAHNGTERATGTVLIESVEFTCNIEAGGQITANYTFGGNSALTFSSTTTAVTDATTPDLYPSVVCAAQWAPVSGSLSYAAIEDVQSWRFKLAKALRPYVSSSTSSVRKRTVGAWSGITMGIQALQGNPSEYVTASMVVGAFGGLKLFVTASENWEFKWAQVLQMEENVPIGESGNVGFDIQFGFSGFAAVTGTQTRGFLKNPAGSSVWS